MIAPGQQEHILYSANVFRQLLDSLARPGKITALAYPQFVGKPPYYHSWAANSDIPLNLYALGALWTLLDREVSFVVAANGEWLECGAPINQWLTLRSGASVAEPEQAAFAFFCDGRSNGLLTQLTQGTLLEPEASATAVYCVERLTDTSGILDERWITLELQGPGIPQKRALKVAGLDKDEIKQISATRQHYPTGIDVYLIDAVGCCIGLPRTTRIMLVGQED